MKYIILEIQKLSDGTISTPPLQTEDILLEARSKFYSVCAIAAISQVPVHTVVLMTDVGQVIGIESFDHTKQSED